MKRAEWWWLGAMALVVVISIGCGRDEQKNDASNVRAPLGTARSQAPGAPSRGAGGGDIRRIRN